MNKKIVKSFGWLLFTLVFLIFFLCNLQSNYVVFYMIGVSLSIVVSILAIQVLLLEYGITIILNIKDTDADIERKIKKRQEHYNYTQDDLFKDLDFLERIVDGGWNNDEQQQTISNLFINLTNKWKNYSMFRHVSISERLYIIIKKMNKK